MARPRSASRHASCLLGEKLCAGHLIARRADDDRFDWRLPDRVPVDGESDRADQTAIACGIAIGTMTRMKALPDVLTLAELATAMSVDSWFGVAAPADATEIIAKPNTNCAQL